MAVNFILQNRRILFHGGQGQNGKKQEIHSVSAASTNAATSFTLNTQLHKVEGFTVGVVGTAGIPYLNEQANIDGDGAISSGGSSVALTWANAPKTTQYMVSLFGH